MDGLFMHDFIILHLRSRYRIEGTYVDRQGLACRNRRRREPELDGILNWFEDFGNQRHAAKWALAGCGLADFRMHGANVLLGGLRPADSCQSRQTQGELATRKVHGWKGHTAVVVNPPSTAIT